MAYKVLYRKYRPKNFDTIVGQNNIISILKNSIIENNFSHAYIFTGPRGTGKTSTAKVFAKAINCSNSLNGEPCDECSDCINFDTSPDIIEIDAASNNGVDEIRELRNNINLAPSASKYKVYIIDEVHMLSTGAFNALLKTLEEPPAHAIFILATTEVYKVPITILSRCQRYDFKKIEKNTMVDHLKKICTYENIEYENGVLEEIYSLSEGCCRDALSILDQLSKTTAKITIDYILENYGVMSDKTIDNLLNDVSMANIPEIIEIIEKYENNGVNAQKLIKKIINNLELKAINIKVGIEKKYNFKMIDSLIRELNQIYMDARINENIYTMIKLCFLEQVNVTTQINNQSLSNSNKSEMTIKDDILKPKGTSNGVIDKVEINPENILDIRINNCFVGATRNNLLNIQKDWEQYDFEIFSGAKLNQFHPVAASPTHIILTIDDESLSNLYNMKYLEIDDMLSRNEIFYKTICLSTDSWNVEKEKYINNLKQKKNYVLVDEPKIVNSEEDSTKIKASEIFYEDIIELN